MVRRIFNIRYYLFILTLFFCKHLSAQDIENIKSQKPFAISGTLGASLTFYSYNHRQPSHQDFSWMLNGSPVASVYGVTLPFSFAVSEQNRDFRQPFNKFGVSPYYKWVKLHLGWRTTNYSDYTLSDYTWLGAGVELTPKKFRLSFMSGRFNKAVKEDTLHLQNIFQTPSYKRTGFSVKAGYGTEKNYVDVILFKAKDDYTSIKQPFYTNISPGENAVIGLSSKQKITEKISFTLDVAQSLYTRDVRAVVNDSAIVPQSVTGIPSFLLQSNPSTVKGNVIDGSVAYNEKWYGLGLQYKRISPDFFSMGTYYLITDVREITVKPSVSFWKNKIRSQLSFGLQRNNLDDKKSVTTNRTIGSINITAQPFPVYFINLVYSNYGIGQKTGLISPDSVYRVAQTTGNLLLLQTLNIIRKNFYHTISLILNNQTLNDKNKTTDAGYTVFVLNGNYQLGITSLKLSAGAGYLLNSFKNYLSLSTNAGPTLNVSKTYYKDKIRSGISASLLNSKLDGKKVSNVTVISFNTYYKVDKHHGLSLRADYQGSTSTISGGISSNEFKTILSYAYTF